MTEQLLQEIATRITALGEQVSETRLNALIKGQFDALAGDEAFVRKMRFGGGDAKLIGTKFSRWGLGVSDIEFLYDLMNAQRGQSRRGGGVHQGPSTELEGAFKVLSDAAYMSPDDVRALDRQAIDDLFPRINKHNCGQHEAAVRAMDTAESGFGSQLVGAQYVADLWEAARSDMRVANLIGSFEMTAPTAYLPVEVDFPAMYFVAESAVHNTAAFTTSKTGSNRVAVTAKKFVIHQMWSGEMEEDSIIPFIPFLRAQAQKSIAYYLDALAVNGDETTTNGINGSDTVLAAGHYSGAFNGIRHAGLVDNTANSISGAGGAVSLAMFRAVYGRMIDATNLHDWGHPNNPDDVVHVVDPYLADAMLAIDEFATRDKAGNDASLFSGQVTRVYNHPVISSIAVKKSQVTGFVDDDTPGNNTLGQIVTFNRNGCKWGWRRRVQMETERIVSTDQTRIVYSLRVGFGRFTPTGAASGIEWADEVYNVLV